MSKIRFDMTAPQQEVFDDDVTSTIIMSGGLGSGKTFLLCNKILKLHSINKGFAGGILAPDYPSFRKDIKPTFEDIFQKNGVRYKFDQKENAYYLPWNRKPLYVFTAEKPIAGPNLAFCGINEFSLMKYERIKEMTRRVRLKNAPLLQSVFAGTPEDIHGWLEEYKESMEKQNDLRPNAFKIVYANTKDNVYLTDHYLDDLKAVLDEQQIKVFTEGAIIRIGGDYFYYSYSRDKSVDETVKQDPNLIVHVGLDFNVGNMSATFNNLKFNNGKKSIHTFGELVLKGNSNTYTMADAIVERFAKEIKEDRLLITCDAAGASRSTKSTEQLASDVAILNSKGKHLNGAGLRTRYKAQNTRLRSRQLLMNGLLDRGEWKVHPDCKLTIKDIHGCQQSKIDFTKIKTDPNATHLSDTLDYIVDFEFQLPTQVASRISQVDR